MPCPVDIVDKQIEAYRAGDITAFVATYAEDAVCHYWPSGRVIAEGRDAIRRVWGALFARGTMSVDIRDRIVFGPYIIDREQARVGDNPPVDAVAVYCVGDTHIKTVMFLDSGG